MRISTIPLVAAFVFTASCGGDSIQSGPLLTGPVKATINGQAWTSTSAAGAVRSAPGLYSITAIGAANEHSLIFTLNNIGGTGTFPLGTIASLTGGSVVVSKAGASGWSTPLTGVAGEVTITTLTASRIVGTFSFTATPLAGTGNLTVTNGSFDVPVTGASPFGALPDNLGGRFTAIVAGSPSGVNGVTSILTTGASPTLTIIAGGERTINISLANMTGAGTYTLSATNPVRSIQVALVSGTQVPTWYSQGQGATGTVTIATVTATRITGSFTATLVPLAGGALGTLAISGSFDFGRGVSGL